MNKIPTYSDGATPERARQEGGIVLEVRDQNEANGKVLRVGHRARFPTVFHWYESMQRITQGQREAGCRMAVLYYVAGRIPTMPIAWVKEFVSGGMVQDYNPSVARMDAEKEIRRVEVAISPRSQKFLRDACLYNDPVGGANRADTMRRISCLRDGLEIARHLLGIPVYEEGK